ncbi:SAM-dependent methyltransferase [Saccharopolyspora griseoalba]|uniref:SAM-dependent methyltransferase n=1 Tax=Saccharopolyspora griseoalba TaxID=1431848 RepID=A0ABW2LBT8_9PSEU
MYDYYLGGSHNFEADRAAAERVLALVPETRTFARENRAFLQRVVRYLVARAGVTQFLDLGSGIPTVGNVHEIAQGLQPESRVVYVDHEPVAVAQSQRMLTGNDQATAIQGDLRHPDRVLHHPEVHRLLDFSRPVAVLTISVFPFVADVDDPVGIISAYREACAPGSYLALSHGLTLDYWPDATAEVIETYKSSTHPLHPRTPEQITALFAGYQLVEPGVVFTSAWHPDHPLTDEQARESRGMAGLGVLSR